MTRRGEGATEGVVVAVLIFIASVALHVLLALHFPLAPDETYYWEWSRRPAWGYYDQGPMIAWWIRASCYLFGETAFGIRAGIIVASLATQVCLYLLARRLFTARIAVWALIIGSVTPISLAGGFISTYDPLVALFWAAALWLTAKALFSPAPCDPPAPSGYGTWIGLGAALGLGILSKHVMVLYVPCLFLFLAGSEAHRQWLRRPHVYAALALALLVFLPNLIWQMHHHWLTFAHYVVLSGKGTDHGAIRRLGDFVGSQAGLMTPLLFCAMVFALGWSARRGRRDGDARLWFLFCMSAPVLIAFVMMTAKSKVQANWAACGWLTPPIAYAAWLASRGAVDGTATTGSRRARRYLGAAVTFSALLSLLLAFPEARTALHIQVPRRWDQMNKLYGGAELALAADGARRSMEAEIGRPVAVGSATYDMASRMAFYMAGRPRVYCFFLGTRPNSYMLWNDEAKLAPGVSVLVADGRPPDDPLLPRFASVFRRVVPVEGPIRVMRPGVYREPVDTYYLYRCYNYTPVATVPAEELP
jgi:4-amino-4-deoxy-L-arabinose transferase-like glycosyltransferase